MRYVFTLGLLLLFTAFSNISFAQNKITVKGVVKEKSGANKAGVTISTGKPLKSIGSSNENGAFDVSVEAGSTLVFTHIGFTKTERKVSVSTSNLTIIMAETDNSMEAVVVQGFTKKTRETSTGASTIISGKTIQDVPVSNVMELLQGRVAGLNIQNNTGSPGGMGTINLRGVSSASVGADGFISPTSPLFVIDGVPVDVNTNYEYGFQGGGPGISPLALIPPEDIEQMEFLKDAASTSIYGSRGVYGVILITTKRGQSKVPIVQYSSNLFINTPPKLRQIQGGKEERLLRIKNILSYDTTIAGAQALINQTKFLADSLNPFYNNSTNWQDYFYRTTINQNHNLSILGGDQKFNYKTNMNYQNNNGIIENTGFTRYVLGMNAQYAPTDKFKMIVNMTGSLGQKQNGSGVGLTQRGLASNSNTSSLLPPPSLFSENNATLAAANIRDNNKTANISSSLDLQYEIVKGIRLTNILSYNYVSGTSDRFVPSFLKSGSSEAYSYSDRTYTIYDRSTINFVKTINDVHNFSGNLFNEINSYGFQANAVLLRQTAGDQIEGPIGYNWNASRGGTLENIKDTRQHGYGGSFSYNFDKKYVFDLSYRLDGLSTNGPSKGYTKNPAISARWNFGKENWFSKAYWLSYGSLRASWGRNIKPTGSIFDVYGRYNAGTQYNNTPTVFIDYRTVPNTNFLPETQNQSNFGFDLGLFNGKIETTFDAYYRSIDNEVVGIDLADINGFKTLQANAVSLVNYGLDFSVRLRLLKQTNPIQSTISLVGGLNRDVLTQLPNGLRQMVTKIDEQGVQVPVIQRIGRNVRSNLLYHTQGVYASSADVPINIATGLPQQLGYGSGFYFQGGDPRWTDINGDYIIDDADLQPIGNPSPLLTGGISSLSSYKGWQLSVNISYTLDRDLLNSSMAQMFQNYTNPTSANSLLPIGNFDYWKPSQPGKVDGSYNAKYPNPFDFRRAGTLQPFRNNQTLFLEDGSYWKVNNIVLAYNVDKNAIKKFGMTQMRWSVTANNVYTFSKYSGPDPEVVTQLGRDNSGGYPNARSYAIGLSIQF